MALALLVALAVIVFLCLRLHKAHLTLNLARTALNGTVECNARIAIKFLNHWADKHGQYPKTTSEIDNEDQPDQLTLVNPFAGRSEKLVDSRAVTQGTDPRPGEIRYTFVDLTEGGVKKTSFILKAYGAGGEMVFRIINDYVKFGG